MDLAPTTTLTRSSWRRKKYKKGWRRKGREVLFLRSRQTAVVRTAARGGPCDRPTPVQVKTLTPEVVPAPVVVQRPDASDTLTWLTDRNGSTVLVKDTPEPCSKGTHWLPSPWVEVEVSIWMRGVLDRKLHHIDKATEEQTRLYLWLMVVQVNLYVSQLGRRISEFMYGGRIKWNIV